MSKLKIQVPLSKLKEDIQSIRQIVGTVVQKSLFCIRSTSSGYSASIRAESTTRNVTLNLPYAAVYSDKEYDYPVDLFRLAAVDLQGEVTILFGTRSLEVKSQDSTVCLHEDPEVINKVLYPCNGDRLPESYLGKAATFMQLVSSLGLEARVHLRYETGVLYTYVSDGSTIASFSCPMDAAFDLWDIEISLSLYRFLLDKKTVYIDHVHTMGTWISDGETLYYVQESDKDNPDYSYDFPGIARCVRSSKNKLVLSEEVLDYLEESAYLVCCSPGSVQMNRLSPGTLSFHTPIEVASTRVFAADSSSFMSAIFEGSKFRRILQKDSELYFTNWPFAPYVVCTNGCNVTITPPVVQTSSIVSYLPSGLQSVGEKLKDWTGSYDDLIMVPFIGSDEEVAVAARTVAPHAPSTPGDALFLAATTMGLRYIGGVSRADLSTCMMEFRHASLYSKVAVHALYTKAYWPDLDILVHDPSFTEEHGADTQSLYPDWITWDYWCDPESSEVRRDDGKLVSKTGKKRKQLRLTFDPLIAPESPSLEKLSVKPLSIDMDPGMSFFNSVNTSEYSILLLDGNNLLWREMFSKRLQSVTQPSTGKVVGPVFGFIRSLKRWVDMYKPESVVVAWDGQKAAWRKELLPEYGEGRAKKTKSINEHLEDLHNVLPLMGVHSVHEVREEADDILALLSKSYSQKSYVLLLSGDHDFYQLANDKIHIYNVIKKDLIDSTRVARVALLRKVLIGDASDNIPGVLGFGVKSFDSLIQGVEDAELELSFDVVLEYASTSKDIRIQKVAEEKNRAVIDRNRQLIELDQGIQHLDRDVMLRVMSSVVSPVALDRMQFATWVHDMGLDLYVEPISDWFDTFERLTS